MKKIISIIISLAMLLSISTMALAEDVAMNAELEILTDRQSLNLSEIGEFKVSYKVDNKSLTTRIQALATYTLADEDSNVLWSNEADITVSAGGTKKFELVGNVAKYGVHTLSIHIKDKNTNEVLVGEVEVSLSKNNVKLNESAGVSSHFAWTSNPNSTISYLKKMGAKFVRDEIYWEDYLTENGEYVIPEKSEDYINKIIENGMEPVIILNHSINANASIPTDTKEFETFVEGFGEYVYNLVDDLKGRVTYFEVWNEMNTINSGAYGRQYAKMLKTAYEKAKKANPECKIIGPVTAGASNTFFMAMKSEVSDIQNYMDILSFHEYGYKNEPENSEYESTLNSCVNKLKTYFGSDKEIWLTEMGWSEGYEGLTERDTAIYNVRHFLNNSYKKFADKMFIYTWINHTGHPNPYEVNLGLLNGDLSAKKSYSAMAAMNYFLTGFTLDSRNTDNNGNYIYNYKKGNSSEVIVLYNKNDEVKTVNVTPAFENSVLYDMYGNKLKDLTGQEAYNIQVDGEPKYIVNKKAPTSMDYRTNTAEICGMVEGASQYENVMLYVTKPGISSENVLSADSLVYVEQLTLGEGGLYEFSFPMNEAAGVYNIYIGYGKSNSLIGPVQLEVVRDISGYTGVYNTDGEIKSISGIIESHSEVKAKGIIDNMYNADSNAILYASGLKENRVLWIVSDSKPISGYGEHTLEITFDKKQVLEADEIKLFLWKDDMKPIAGNVTSIE